MDISDRVRGANKILYDKLADNYEIIDGRRSEGLHLWVRKRLNEISKMADGGDSLLDIGCGAGFAGRAAKGIFSKLYGMDISVNILKSLFSHGILPVCADAEELCFKTESMDVVVLFSVVHHFYDFRPILSEAYRVLKPHGIIYIDHDMNKRFFRNYRCFINIYRRVSRKERVLGEMKISKELSSLSECQSEGIDSGELREHLISLGFRITKSYSHWYGLSRLTDFVFGKRKFPKGVAPLSLFVAQKANSH